jgi:hypothetical protein
VSRSGADEDRRSSSAPARGGGERNEARWTTGRRRRLFLIRIKPHGADYERWSRWVGDVNDGTQPVLATGWWLINGLKMVMCVGTETFATQAEASMRLQVYVQAALDKMLAVSIDEDPHGNHRFTLRHEGRIVAVSVRRFAHSSECYEAAKAVLRELAASSVPATGLALPDPREPADGTAEELRGA